MVNPNSCRFMKSHEWAHVHGDAATVGISDHAQHEITDVVFVEMPKVGRKVKQGEACSVIESVKAAFDIYAPISGEILAVNEAVAKDPGLVNRSPYDNGWLFKIKPDNPEDSAKLMDHKQYQEFIKSVTAHGSH